MQLDMGDTWMARLVPSQMTKERVGAWDAIIRGAMPYWKLNNISAMKSDIPYVATSHEAEMVTDGIVTTSSYIDAVTAKFKFSYIKHDQANRAIVGSYEKTTDIVLVSCRTAFSVDFSKMDGDYSWIAAESNNPVSHVFVALGVKLTSGEMDIDQAKKFLKTLRGLTSDNGWALIMNSLILSKSKTPLPSVLADYMLDELGDASDEVYLVHGWGASFRGVSARSLIDSLTFGLSARYANVLRKINVSSRRIEYGAELNYATWLAGMQRVPTKQTLNGDETETPIIVMLNCMTLILRETANGFTFAPLFLVALGSMFIKSVKERVCKQPDYLASSYMATQHSLSGEFDIEDPTMSGRGRSDLADMIFVEIQNTDKQLQRNILNGKQGQTLQHATDMGLTNIHNSLKADDRVGLAVNGEALITRTTFGIRNGRYSEWINETKLVEALVYAINYRLGMRDASGGSGVNDYTVRYEFGRIAGQSYDERKYKVFSAWFNHGKSNLEKFMSMFGSPYSQPHPR